MLDEGSDGQKILVLLVAGGLLVVTVFRLAVTLVGRLGPTWGLITSGVIGLAAALIAVWVVRAQSE